MLTLFTQKTHYVIWIAGLLCLVYGIYKPDETVDYQLHDTYFVIALLHLVGVVAFLLFFLGLGYFVVINVKGSVPCFPALLQLILTFLLCYVVLFRIDIKRFKEFTDIDIAQYITQPQDIIILFVLAMLLYSITLTWALLRKQEVE